MKTHIPLDRLKRSRDSGSALYNMHPTDVLGRAGGAVMGGRGGRSDPDNGNSFCYTSRSRDLRW